MGKLLEFPKVYRLDAELMRGMVRVLDEKLADPSLDGATAREINGVIAELEWRILAPRQLA